MAPETQEAASTTPRAENVLARVLEAPSDDARVASLPLTIPREWIGDCRLDIRLPKRMRCDGCDGGGCSRCSNRGGFDVPEGAPLVSLNARIPADGAKVRVMNPLGEAGPIDVVVFRVAVGDNATPSISRRVGARASLAKPAAPAQSPLKWILAIAAAIAIVSLALALR